MFTIAERKNSYRTLSKYLETHQRNAFNIGKVLGRGLQGTVYRASAVIRNKKHVIVIKRTNVTRGEYNKGKDAVIFSKATLKKSVFIELASSQLANQLVLQGICPNFALSYHYQFVSDCNQDPQISTKRYCSIQYNEYISNGTFQDFAKRSHREEVWYNAIFQILAGLYALKYHFNLFHNDFHGRNLLVQKIEPGGYWIYIIDGVRYYVPNFGYVFIISDFGFSWIPDKMFPKDYVRKKDQHYHLMDSYKTKLTKNTRLTWDLYKLKVLTIDPLLKVSKKLPKHFKSEFMDIFKGLIDNTENVSTLGDIIKELYGSVIVKKRGCEAFPNYCYNEKRFVSGKRIETYNFDKKLKVNTLDPSLKHLVL